MIKELIVSNKQADKKILLITYHFPPSFAVGGFRMAGFVKYLPMYGWKPYVLTLNEKYIENKDSSHILEFEHIKIIRARPFPSLRDSYLFIKKGLHKITSRGKKKKKETTRNNLTKTEDNLSSEGLTRKLKRYFISLFITLPDTERNWIIPAIIRAFREIKNEKINVILTSGPPHSVHIIGMVINMFTNIHWIADFRDPWMTPFHKASFPTSRLSNLIERGLERKIFKNADLVTATTEKLTHKFKKKYNDLRHTRIKFHPNGFDQEVFAGLNQLKKYDTFTISYTGSIYLSRSPEPLFCAIKELVEEDRLKLSNLRIKLIGHCKLIGDHLTSDVVSSYGLDTVVEVSDYVPYKKALEIIKKSHVALLLATNQPYQIPAKVYDYMGTGTKILALITEGATADLISSSGIGEAFAPDDMKGIKDYVHKLSLNKQNSNNDGEKNSNQYIRAKIIKDLAHELDLIALN